FGGAVVPPDVTGGRLAGGRVRAQPATPAPTTPTTLTPSDSPASSTDWPRSSRTERTAYARTRRHRHEYAPDPPSQVTSVASGSRQMCAPNQALKAWRFRKF